MRMREPSLVTPAGRWVGPGMVGWIRTVILTGREWYRCRELDSGRVVGQAASLTSLSQASGRDDSTTIFAGKGQLPGEGGNAQVTKKRSKDYKLPDARAAK